MAHPVPHVWGDCGGGWWNPWCCFTTNKTIPRQRKDKNKRVQHTIRHDTATATIRQDETRREEAIDTIKIPVITRHSQDNHKTKQRQSQDKHKTRDKTKANKDKHKTRMEDKTITGQKRSYQNLLLRHIVPLTRRLYGILQSLVIGLLADVRGGYTLLLLSWIWFVFVFFFSFFFFFL